MQLISHIGVLLLSYSSLIAVSVCELHARQNTNPTSPDIVAIFSVLKTALPQSLVGVALTNYAAASSDIAAEFKAGSTPAWFTALPTDVKTYLLPLATNPGLLGSALATQTKNPTGSTATASSTGSTSGTSGASSTSTDFSSSSTASDMSSTTSSTKSTSSQTSTPRSSTTSTSSAGAYMPTAMMGAALAGAAGCVGLIVL